VVLYVHALLDLNFFDAYFLVEDKKINMVYKKDFACFYENNISEDWPEAGFPICH
jgi:hypothetical protein